MSDVTFDFTAVRQLAADLGEITPAVQRNTRKAVQVTAQKVKTAWNEKLYAEGHADRTRGAITYDLDPADPYFPIPADSIGAEIGAKTGSGRQAGVVRLLENGSAKQGTAAHGYGAAALHENEADLENGIAKASADAEHEAGL